VESFVIMDETTAYWGTPRWQVYEVPAKGTGPGPVIGSPPAATRKAALRNHKMACEHSFKDAEKARAGREYILILSPNWGPTERWLKAKWF